MGGVDLGATWIHVPSGDAGIYHGSVEFTGHTGRVTITITRSGSTIASIGGEDIFDGCSQVLGIENWNAWVGNAMAGYQISIETASLADQVCVQG